MEALPRRFAAVVPSPVGAIAGMARGTALAQLAMLAAIPVLARLYGSEQFGVFGIVSTAGAALATGAAARFEQAIVPAADDTAAAGLAHAALGLALTACVLLAGLLATVLPWLGGSPDLHAALLLLPVGVAAQSAGQVLLQWATRRHLDGAITKFYGERALVMAAAQVALGLAGSPVNGLVLGQIAGFAAAAALLWRRSGGIPPAGGARAAFARALTAARAQLDFPRYGLPRTALEAAAVIAQPILVAALFGQAAMGGYWMAMRILGLPGAVLGDPVRQVFFRRAAERRRAGQALMPLAGRAFLALSAVTLPFALLLVLASHTLFAIVLGAAWDDAARFVKIMAVGWLATFASGLLPSIVILLGVQRQHFAFELALRAAGAAALLVGYRVGSMTVALALLAGVDIAHVIGLSLFLRLRELRSPLCATANSGSPGSS